jgi:hypothetical protein
LAIWRLEVTPARRAATTGPACRLARITLVFRLNSNVLLIEAAARPGAMDVPGASVVRQLLVIK